MIKKTTNTVYLILTEDFPEVDVICMNQTALSNYLKEKVKEFECNFNEQQLQAELKSIKTYFDIEYEIAINIPKDTYRIITYELENSYIDKLNSASEALIGVSAMPYIDIRIFDNKEQATEWEQSFDGSIVITYTNEIPVYK